MKALTHKDKTKPGKRQQQQNFGNWKTGGWLVTDWLSRPKKPECKWQWRTRWLKIQNQEWAGPVPHGNGGKVGYKQEDLLKVYLRQVRLPDSLSFPPCSQKNAVSSPYQSLVGGAVQRNLKCILFALVEGKRCSIPS